MFLYAVLPNSFIIQVLPVCRAPCRMSGFRWGEFFHLSKSAMMFLCMPSPSCTGPTAVNHEKPTSFHGFHHENRTTFRRVYHEKPMTFPAFHHENRTTFILARDAEKGKPVCPGRPGVWWRMPGQTKTAPVAGSHFLSCPISGGNHVPLPSGIFYCREYSPQLSAYT